VPSADQNSEGISRRYEADGTRLMAKSKGAETVSLKKNEERLLKE
jgi:hypothetical protein